MNLEQLKKKHQELGEEIKKLEKKEKKPWRAEDGDDYWFVYSVGDFTYESDCRNDNDDYRYLTGNYFETEEEAKRYLERQKAIGRVTHAIYALQGDWKPKNEMYYTIEFDGMGFAWHGINSEYQIVQSIIPKINGSVIARQIIKDHEEDLRIIFEI